MKAKLSEKEEKFLSRMEKNSEYSSYGYAVSGMIFFLGILFLVSGIVVNKEYFVWAIYCGSLGIFSFLTVRTHQRFIQIIQKLKDE
jgi:hypothetical protein